MAEVLVLVLSKIGSPLAEKAVSELWGEISKVKVLPRNVAEIRRELRVMKDVILKKGTTYLYDEEHKEWRGWIAEVRTLAYRVEDVMDKYLYYALKLGEEGYVKRNVFKAARYTKAFRGIAQDMADIDRDIKSIAGLLDRWLRPDHFPRPPQHVNASQRPRLFPHLVADEELVGMDAAKKSLEELLYSAENTYVVITVSGMGGLGKTNLVWNMYEREMSKFQEHAWVDAWQNPGSEALLKELVKGIRNQSQPDPDGIDRMLHYKLKQELEEAVAGKRCLIVLDDVQDNEAFNTIRKAFMKVQSGSRIIITTRSRDELAEPAPSRHRIELRPLDNEHARDLFCRLSSLDMQHNCPRVFQDLAGATVEGCGNHSSAIISIAKQLSRESRTEEHWKETCNQFRSVLAKDDIVLRILHRSYYALHEELRNCFLFCSLFPEDYPMSREVLMRLWIAEGFVEAKEWNTPEMVAEGYIRKLIQQNMLQPVDTDDFGMVVTCKMHPIMRILALSLSEEIDFGAANDHATMKQLGERVRRLSNCRPREQMLNAIKCLRTLIAVNHNTSASDKCSWIPDKSIYLAVLELQGTTIDTLPDSIGDLFNLRYIGLRKTNVKSLPESIGRLSYLKTLDLKSTYIQKLPRGIKKLKRLRHLFADRCTDKSSSDLQYFKGVAAPNGLSGLEELQIIETVEASNELGQCKTCSLQRFVRIPVQDAASLQLTF
jgi:disease resistance protein RPM1